MRAPALAAALALIAAACAGPALAFTPPATPTKPVALSRYVGKWYEIARVHTLTENGCQGSSADYQQGADGKVTVVEVCHKGSVQGPLKTYIASAQILDPGVNAQMKLTFKLLFVPISRDYWVLDHGADYRWAIVGDPTGKYLWLFSRTPTIPAPERDMLLTRARQLGYDTRRLEFVQQTG